MVLAIGDPLAAGRPADRADTRPRQAVYAASVIDYELLLATERRRHDLLNAPGVTALELLVVEGGEDRGESAFDLDFR